MVRFRQCGRGWPRPRRFGPRQEKGCRDRVRIDCQWVGGFSTSDTNSDLDFRGTAFASPLPELQEYHTASERTEITSRCEIFHQGLLGPLAV